MIRKASLKRYPTFVEEILKFNFKLNRRFHFACQHQPPETSKVPAFQTWMSILPALDSNILFSSDQPRNFMSKVSEMETRCLAFPLEWHEKGKKRRKSSQPSIYSGEAANHIVSPHSATMESLTRLSFDLISLFSPRCVSRARKTRF